MYDQLDQNQEASEGRDSGSVDKLGSGVVQRKGDGAASSSTRDVAAAGFAGPTMDLPYRSEMESGFGRSFSNVQAYGGGAAAEANSAMNAQAYTVGSQIAFKDSNPDKAVVAHELAHTVQQDGAGPVQTWTEGKDGDAFETEADDAAATVLAGGVASPTLRTGPSLHKWGGSDHYTIGNLAGQKALAMFHAAFPGVDPMTPEVVLPQAADGSGVLGGGVMHGANAAEHPDHGPMEPHDAGTGMKAPDEHDTHTLGVRTNKGGLISFGAASRAGGDYVTTVDGLADRKNELGGTKKAGGGNWVTDKMQFAAMAIGGTTNSNHFFPVNGKEYGGHHETALGHARAAGAMAKANNPKAAEDQMAAAMQEEGFGNHFLQDTFASGHMAPRSLDSTEHLVGHGVSTVAKAMDNVQKGITHTVAAATGTVGKAAGTVTGGIVGAIGGFGSGVGDWFSGKWTNPFASAAEGASQKAQDWGDAAGNAMANAGQAAADTVTSPLKTPTKVEGFVHDASQGLMRTKQWHDYFCALPEGLPTTRGRFHGDYFMDGNDLEVVSDTCANSIFNVLATAHGKTANKAVEVPRPDFGAIMADAKIAPVWRLMMSDYEKDLQAAQDNVQPGDTHKTDGGVTVDSKWIIEQIKNTTMGGDKGIADAQAHTGEAGAALGVTETVAEASRAPLETINKKRTELRDSLDGVRHYATTHFGFNAMLGQIDPKTGKPTGLDDDLNAPEKRDAEDTGFDPVQIETTFGLYTSLSRYANEFVVAASAAGAEVDDTGRLANEKTLAQTIAKDAAAWAHRAQSLKGSTDAFDYGLAHGTIGKGDAKKKRTELRNAVTEAMKEWAGAFGADYAAKVAAPAKSHARAG